MKGVESPTYASREQFQSPHVTDLGGTLQLHPNVRVLKDSGCGRIACIDVYPKIIETSIFASNGKSTPPRAYDPKFAVESSCPMAAACGNNGVAIWPIRSVRPGMLKDRTPSDAVKFCDASEFGISNGRHDDKVTWLALLVLTESGEIEGWGIYINNKIPLHIEKFFQITAGSTIPPPDHLSHLSPNSRISQSSIPAFQGLGVQAPASIQKQEDGVYHFAGPSTIMQNVQFENYINENISRFQNMKMFFLSTRMYYK